MILAIDFDGTCVTSDYPKIGKDIGAVPILKKLAKSGHKLILNTMRSGKELQDAVNWFNKNRIPLYGINENPTQSRWTTSPKVYADFYLDDAAIGAPLKFDMSLSSHPFIDWNQVADFFEDILN